MTTLATDKTVITFDYPDWAAKVINLRLETTVAVNSAGEVILQKDYPITLDANGVGSSTYPTPDSTGALAWLYRVNQPDGTNQLVSIAYNAASQDIATILAASVSTTTPSSLSSLVTNKQDKVPAATLNNFASWDAAGQTKDSTKSAASFDTAGSAAAVLATSLQKASNLSDVANSATARTNIGAETAGAAAAVLATSLQKASNLSDVASATTARANISAEIVGQTYNVLNYASIQAALDAANAAGGGTVSLKSGTTYALAFASGFALQVYPNITIEGNGATLRVPNATGNYESILSTVPDSADLSNFTVRNVIFDHNSTNNAVTNPAQLSGANSRLAIRVFGGQHIRIEGCTFKDIQATNTITANAADMKDVHIINNKFYSVGGGSVDFDHSTIYVHGENIVITGNIFEAASQNANGARTAIETHGSGVVVSDNVVKYYRYGAIVSGVSATDSNGLVCSNNTFRRVLIGVVLYSNQYGAHTTGYGIDGAVISNNTIQLMDASTLAATSSPSGIIINAPSDLPLRNIRIENNVIMATLPLVSRQPNESSVGIGLVGTVSAAGEVLENITIKNNTIHNMEMAGIRFSVGTIKNLEISGNKIVNPASTLYVAANAFFRCGIFMWSNTNVNTLIQNNEITDDNTTSRIINGMYLQAGTSSSFIEVLDNKINLTGSTLTSYLEGVALASINIIPYLRAKYDTWTLPTFWFKQGSTVEVGPYKHTLLTNGGVWIAEGFGSAAPAAGTWSRGSKIYTTSATATGFIGWVCTAGGTPGTWKTWGVISA